MNRPSVPVAGLVTLGLLGVVAAVVSWSMMPNGPAFGPDSAIYFGVSHNLLHGRGLTSPITLAFTDYFPPLATFGFDTGLPVTTLPPGYSAAVAAFGALGASIDTAARFVGAASLGAATFLFGYLVLRVTGRTAAALAGVVLLLGAAPLAEGFAPGSWVLLSTYALAEMLFLPFVFATILALAHLLGRPTDRNAALLGAGVVGALAAVATLVRFLGVSLILVAAVLILARTAWSWRRRIALAAVVVGVGLTPVAAWALGMRVFVGHGEPSTPLRYHPYDAETIGQGVRNLANWFVPADVASPIVYAVLVVVALGLVAMAVVTRRRRGPADASDPVASWIVVSLLAFVVAYLVTVSVSHMAANGDVRFDIRFLAPVRPAIYAVAVIVVYRFLVAFRLRGASFVVLGVALVVAAPFADPLLDVVRDGTARDAQARETPLFRAIRALPDDALIFSDAPDAVWLGADRASILVPIRYVRESGLDNERFPEDMRQLDELLARPDTYLVMFSGVHPGVLASLADIQQDVELEVVGSYPQGTIYRKVPAAAPTTAPGATQDP